MSNVNRRHADHYQGDSDNGSAIQIGSPVYKDYSEDHVVTGHRTKSSSKLAEKANAYLLALSFGLSVYLLFLTVTTASQNNMMLASLQPYAVDLVNGTNKTWGYGGMPVKMNAGDKTAGHDHAKNPQETEPVFDPDDFTALLKDTWKPPQGNDPFTIFPTTTDTVDELRPDELVSYDTNFLVKKHVR
jgi:hypothetical protein